MSKRLHEAIAIHDELLRLGVESFVEDDDPEETAALVEKYGPEAGIEEASVSWVRPGPDDYGLFTFIVLWDDGETCIDEIHMGTVLKHTDYDSTRDLMDALPALAAEQGFPRVGGYPHTPLK